MSSAEDKLKDLRKQIDAIDTQIKKLVNQRGEVALNVATAKREAGDNPVYYRPEREAQLLRATMQENEGPIADKDLARIMRAVMSSCLALQQPAKIAFLGPIGTFSHQAAVKHFGESIVPVSIHSIADVFRSVHSGDADYGVVPIENNSNGMINLTFDCLIDTSLVICGEISLPIQQCLLSNSKHDEIVRIYSHEQSFIQCQQWLQKCFPDAEQVRVSSNAAAAKKAQHEKGSAAIASELCAGLYGLDIHHTNIHDNPKNTTRFIIIGSNPAAPSGDDKTTLSIATKNSPGALNSILSRFTENGINLSMITSKPYQHQIWDYIFLIEILGHQEDETVHKVLEEFSKEPVMLNVLGSYPTAVL